MTNLDNNNYLLTETDSRLIAISLGYSERQVRLVRKGKRGKRKTLIQKHIKIALEYRSRQNLKFIKFCKDLKDAASKEDEEAEPS